MNGAWQLEGWDAAKSTLTPLTIRIYRPSVNELLQPLLFVMISDTV
jgi:hypothetical protein